MLNFLRQEGKLGWVGLAGFRAKRPEETGNLFPLVPVFKFLLLVDQRVALRTLCASSSSYNDKAWLAELTVQLLLFILVLPLREEYDR